VRFSWGDSGRALYALHHVGDLIESGRFSLVVGQAFRLTDVAEAHRIGESGTYAESLFCWSAEVNHGSGKTNPLRRVSPSRPVCRHPLLSALRRSRCQQLISGSGGGLSGALLRCSISRSCGRKSSCRQSRADRLAAQIGPFRRAGSPVLAMLEHSSRNISCTKIVRSNNATGPTSQPSSQSSDQLPPRATIDQRNRAPADPR
jgi:hypothetical protein